MGRLSHRSSSVARSLVIASVPIALWVASCGDDGEDLLPVLSSPSSHPSTGPSSSSSTSGTHSASSPPCVAPNPPPAALLKAGRSGDTFVLPGGRALTPEGRQVELGGFPVQVRVHPAAGVAYVANTGYGKRGLQVIRLSDGALAQPEIVRQDAYYGLALAPDGKRLYASGGASGLVEYYEVAADGTLSAAGQLPVPNYPAGLVVSHDNSKLWVGEFLSLDPTTASVVEIDLNTMKVVASVPLGANGAYDLVEVPGRNELYASQFRESHVAVVDLATHSVAASIDTGKNPEGLAVTSDGKTVYVAMPDLDAVLPIDTASRSVVTSVAIGGEGGLVDAKGKPLPASSPTGLALDEATGRLYVTRAGDNAVEVLDQKSYTDLGSFAVGWYPVAAALADGGATLVVVNAKGVGTGPNNKAEYGPNVMNGTVSIVPVKGLDLATASAKVLANVRRPGGLDPFTCAGDFPVPTHAGGKTPIEHVILVVRENKTYDTLLGDLGEGDGAPDHVLFGEKVTPNLHALARGFAHHDNFYDDSEVSVQGHLWLTSSFVNDYMEKAWLEDYRGHGDFSSDSALAPGQPAFGTFFTHLIQYKVPFTDYGEVVGSLGSYGDDAVFNHVDSSFPGLFFDLTNSDESRAKYVVDQIVNHDKMPPFIYMILPRDHTNGTTPGALTPASMVADNDYATGLLVDGVSHSKYWHSTAIFVVEDDPQIGADHVDYHRSICVVASPWAKRGYVSHVNTSYPSIFRTLELILNVPPMNRYDASATPLWDVFTNTFDDTPFTALPRQIPDTTNPADAVGADVSARMDFSGPDKNPLLGDLLWWAMKGAPPPGSPLNDARVREHLGGESVGAPSRDDDDDEYDRAVHAFRAYVRSRPTAPTPNRP